MWGFYYFYFKKPFQLLFASQVSMRKLNTTEGWQFLQGKGKTEGKLLGGCLEVLEFLKGTDYWLDKREWQNAILFLETSELMPSPDHFRWALRNYAAQGILSSINGILLGRPYDNKFSGEYNQVLLQVITEEMALTGLPIITGMDFGHTSPTFTIPYGVKAEINCEAQTFSIIESALQD
jgi:muramoyltetrapeptide carboxypeptidase LdcA involved in peptidoglycan recycling